MGKTYGQLAEVTTAADTDLLALSTSGGSKKIKARNLVAIATPSGIISPYGGSSAPSGWLICDGSAVSRTTYAALYAILGTAYGTGDGSTTFNLPNLKGKVPVGKDSGQTEFDAMGETGGAKTHTLITAEMPSHTHVVATALAANGAAIASATGALVNGSATGVSNTGGGGAHNNLQPYQVVNYIVKS